MSIMTVKDLKKKAPKGEFLAYINKEEAAALKRAGGSGHLVNGIPSFIGSDYSGDKDSKGNVGTNTSGYQGGMRGKGGYQGITGETNKTKSEGGSGSGNFTNAQAATDKTNREIAIRAEIAKRELEKSKYDVGPKKNFNIFDFGKKYLKNRQKGLYSIFGNNPKTELRFLNNLYTNNKTEYDKLSQSLKDRYEETIDPANEFSSYKDFSKFSFDDFDDLTKIGDKDFAKYAAKYAGSPGLLYSGNMGAVGDKFVATRNPDGSPATYGYGPVRGGDGGQQFIPINYNTGAATTEAVEPYTNDFTYRMGDPAEAANVTRASYIFNKGGRVPAMEGGIMGTRARRAMGGIMNRVDQRQGYFLGGIGKAIKGAVSGVVDATKKVLKSDIGKAALLYAGGAYLGGSTMMGGAGGSFMSRMASPSNLMNLLKNTKGRGLFDLASRAGGSLFGEDSVLKKAGESMIGEKTDTFADNALRFGKFLAPAYLLSKTKLGEAKPNEESYMADRTNNKLVDPLNNRKSDPAAMTATLNEALENAGGDPDKIAAINKAYRFLNDPRLGDDGAKSVLVANGGRIRRAEGGLMDLGGMEKDYRAEGGFVPIGEYEKKDDVPARLSVNEFVFTADAVRGAGQGDIDKGAEIMENMMENLENGGTVSEESQGNKGAQQMFETSQRLGEVV